MGILMGRARCLGQESAEWASFRGTYAMANDNKPKKNPSDAPPRSSAKGLNERPFDKWLQKQLHAMYDEIASEPLPDELLTLIESDASKGKARKSSSEKK